MLDNFRKNMSTKNVVGWSLLIIICGVFVFFGLPQQFGIPGAGSAATVNGEMISVADLQSEESRLTQAFANFLGDDQVGAQRQFIRQQALQNLITIELISQAAKEQGIRATDEEIRNFLINEPAFQVDGFFQRENYRRYLEAVRLSPKAFEEKLRKDRQNMRVRKLVEAAIAPLDVEIEKQRQLRNQRMNVEFIQIDRQALAQRQDISDSQVQEALADEAFLQRAKSHFNENKSEYSKPEQVSAQHILVRVDPQAEEGRSKAMEKMTEIQKQLETREFAEVAKEFSDDPGSKEKGGDLGFFERGQMVPSFEEVAFTLPPGEVSDVVESQFGLHLIKVNEKRPAQEANFEENQEEIARQLIAVEEIEKQVAELDEKIKAQDNQAVQSLIKELGVQWQETEWFDLASNRVPKLGSAPDLLSSVFSLTEPGQMLPRLVFADDKHYILRLKAMEKTDQAPRDEVLEEQIMRDRTIAVYEGWVDNIRNSSNIDINNAVFSEFR